MWPPTLKVLELTNLPTPMPSRSEKLVTSKSCVAVTLPAMHLEDVLARHIFALVSAAANELSAMAMDEKENAVELRRRLGTEGDVPEGTPRTRRWFRSDCPRAATPEGGVDSLASGGGDAGVDLGERGGWTLSPPWPLSGRAERPPHGGAVDSAGPAADSLAVLVCAVRLPTLPCFLVHWSGQSRPQFRWDLCFSA
jgi:hypothetical protein